jgi:DNA-binding MarR family transcriptional regulator
VPRTPAYRVLIDAVAHLTRVQREIGTTLSRDLDCSRTSLSLVWVLDRDGEMGVGDIAQQLRVDISVASRQATALVEAGLAERRTPTAPGADRRVRTIGLTDAGRAFAARARHELDQRAAVLFSTWSAADLLAAAGSVDRIAGTIAAHVDDLIAFRAGLAPTDPAAAPLPTGVLAGSAT